MKKKHILFILPSLNQGGAEIAMIRIANKFHEKNEYYSEILVTGPYDIFLKNTIKCKSTFFNKKTFLSTIHLIYDYIRKTNNPNLVVFTTIINTNVVLTFIKFFLKFKLIIREASNPKLFQKKSFRLKFYYFFAKICYKNADFLVSNSIDKIDLMKKYYGVKLSKIFYLPNPINSKPKITKQKSSINLNDENFNIVCLGRITASKSREDAIQAMNFLIKKNNKIELHIIGPVSEKSYYNFLLNEVDRLGLSKHVFFHPKTYDVINTLKRFDLFLATSKYEGFPNTILDAAVANIPILSSDCDFGPRELLSKYKVGMLYKLGSIDDLIDGINKIMHNDYEFNRKDFRKIILKFSVNEVYRILYNKLEKPHD